MESVSRRVFERLGGKIRVQSVPARDGPHNRLERDRVVRGGQRVGKPKIDFVLAGPLLMMRTFRPHAHLLERQTNLAPYIFAFIFRIHVHIPRGIIGDFRRRVAFV